VGGARVFWDTAKICEIDSEGERHFETERESGRAKTERLSARLPSSH
jgi:hypothetical protein